ncbi:DUF2637 domain-containing protein [Streptosporangium sp. NPDC051023]|uniref:DUF2637 domain-containing protein n=1 Tax=Streptosporangium sp. NPDC051023 TaxID=3155410 RepID=UPI00344CB315
MSTTPAPDPAPTPGKATSSKAARLATYAIDAPIVLLVLLVGVLGFIGSFDGMVQAMRPYFGNLAWIVPTGIDASILAFSAADLRLILRGLPVAGLRYAVWFLSAVTVALNFIGAKDAVSRTAAETAGAATGVVPAAGAEVPWLDQLMGQVAHAMMPVLWIIAIEVGRKAVAKFYRLEHDAYMEPIPWDMWLRPVTTARMWLRRRTSRIKSLDELVARDQARLLAIMRLRHQARAQGVRLSRWRWRRVATADELWAIRTYNLDPSGAMRRTAAVVSRGILSADLVAATAVTAAPAPAALPGPAEASVAAGGGAAPVHAPTPAPVHARSTVPPPARPADPVAVPAFTAAAVNGHGVNDVNVPAEPPPGRPENVGARTWANLFSSPEGNAAWDAYVAHRAETDEVPEVRHLRERVDLSKDRTTVSKWMPLFHARWEVEHGVDVHAEADVQDSDEGVDVHARKSVNGASDEGVHAVHETVPDTVEGLVAEVDAMTVNGSARP